MTKTGYYLDLPDTNNWGWLDVAGGGEVADLCVDQFGLGQDETNIGAFIVQRVRSNAQAGAGLDPCNPLPVGQVYFNAAPRQSLFVLDVGASATFTVDVFSGGPMSDWTLSAEDWSDSVTPSYQVTVTLLQDPGPLDTGEADGAIVSVFQGSGASPMAHWWPFVVMSTADAVDAGINKEQRLRHLPDAPRVHRAQRRVRPFAAHRQDWLSKTARRELVPSRAQDVSERADARAIDIRLREFGGGGIASARVLG